MKKIKNNEITICIVTKNRSFELSRLLKSLNKSAKISNLQIGINLGIEINTYKNLKKYTNLKINKIYFKKKTSPVIIKNYLYNLNLSKIKIFLDDDVEVNYNFLIK